MTHRHVKSILFDKKAALVSVADAAQDADAVKVEKLRRASALPGLPLKKIKLKKTISSKRALAVDVLNS